MNSAAMNAVNSPVVSRPAVISWLPYQSAADERHTADELHQRREHRTTMLVTFMLVR